MNCKRLYDKLRNLIQCKIKLAKQSYNVSYINELNTTNTSHADYWSFLYQFWKPNKQCNYPITLNEKPVHDEYVKCNLFNEYFASISNYPAYDINKLPPLNFLANFLTDHRLLPPIFDPFQVFRVLSSLHPNKCKGFDNFPNRILKICSQSLATPFSLLFNLILSSEVFPTSLKTATVIQIHKTGSQTVVQNYRPIVLLPSLSKVFEKLLYKHVYSYLQYHKLLIPKNILPVSVFSQNLQRQATHWHVR